jgi:hypothetical protein
MLRVGAAVLGALMVAACGTRSAGPGSLEAGPATDAAAALACSSPQDCIAHLPSGPEAFCCIKNACVYGQAALATSCTDPDAQVIAASNYDQSCKTDTDCIGVAVGNFCKPGALNCSNAAINKSASGQYQADVAKTWAGAVCFVGSSCGEEGSPCCRNGTCQIGGQCFSVSAPVDSGTEATSSEAGDASSE